MTSAASHVLLLGWDDTPRTGEQPTPSVLTMVQALAPRTPLAIVLPRRPPTLGNTPNAHVTVLSELTPDQLHAFPSRPAHPAGWQAPSAPYVGSSEGSADATASRLAVPAAPYVGSSIQSSVGDLVTEAASVVLGTGLAGSSTAAKTAALSAAEPVASPEGGLLNRDDFAEQEAEPAATEAHDLSQPQDDLTTDTILPENPAVAPALFQDLPDGMAALQLTPEPDADLNFQVIQYARLATRQVMLENFAVIYATDWPTWLAAMEIRQQTGRPLVLHVHSLAEDRNTAADRGWILELERLTMRRADLVLASSEEVAERLRVAYPVAAQNLRVVSPTDTTTLTNVLSQLETTWAGR